MNKKIIGIGLLIFIAIGFYTNAFGLFGGNDHFKVTNAGTLLMCLMMMLN